MRLTECAVKESNLQPTIRKREHGAGISAPPSQRATLGQPLLVRTPAETPNASDNETATLRVSGSEESLGLAESQK